MPVSLACKKAPVVAEATPDTDMARPAPLPPADILITEISACGAGVRLRKGRV